MSEVGSAYGEALYSLAREEGLSQQILQELTVLNTSFQQEPAFVRLLQSPNLSKQERCGILDSSFRGKFHTYVLSFLKILTEKGNIGHFSACCAAYKKLYNHDNGILPVTAVSAVALSDAQRLRLTEKLSRLTGKTIDLVCRVDPSVLGGMRLDYDGKQLDDTVAHRLDSVRSLLQSSIL